MRTALDMRAGYTSSWLIASHSPADRGHVNAERRRSAAPFFGADRRFELWSAG